MICFPRFLLWLTGILFILPCVVICLWFPQPLYVDEILHRLIHARLFIDGWLAPASFPQCGNAYTVPYPYSWIVAVTSRAAWHSLLGSLIGIKVLAIASALLVVLLTKLYAARLDRLSGSSGLPQILALSTLCLGLAPAALAVGRVEQDIALALTAVSLIVVRRSNSAPSPAHGVWSALGILLCASVLFSSHPKTLFLVPLLVFGVLIVQRTRTLRTLFLVALILITLESTQFYLRRLACPGAASVRTMYETVSPLYAGAHGLSWLTLSKNLLLVSALPQHLLYLVNPSGSWTPALEPSLFAMYRLANVCAFVSLIALVMLVSHSLVIVRFPPHLRYLRLWCLLLAGSCFAALSVNARQSFYEITWLIPCLGIIAASAGAALAQQKRPWAIIVASTIGIAAMIIGMTLVIHLLSVANPADRIDHPTWQQAEEYAPEAHAAAERCGLSVDGNLKRVVVDDFTYGYFRRVQQPIYIDAVGKWGKDIGDPLAFLASRGSDGLITRV